MLLVRISWGSLEKIAGRRIFVYVVVDWPFRGKVTVRRLKFSERRVSELFFYFEEEEKFFHPCLIVGSGKGVFLGEKVKIWFGDSFLGKGECEKLFRGLF